VRATVELPAVAARLVGAAGGAIAALGIADASPEFVLSPAALSDDTT
jgi:hypothetical protein